MVLVMLLGLLLGPPLNLLIDRLPLRKSLLARPACAVCGSRRPRYALVPIMGWLLARGRCEICQVPLPRRILLIDLALPLAGVVICQRNTSELRACLGLLLAAYLLAIVVIDLDHRLVLNVMTGVGLLSAFVIAAAGLGPSTKSALIGTVVGFLFLWIPTLLFPGLGMGDVKLSGVIGALVGYPAVFTALTVGVLIGGLAAGVLLITRRIERRGTIAYAPYLVIGVTLVFFGVLG